MEDDGTLRKYGPVRPGSRIFQVPGYLSEINMVDYRTVATTM